MSILEGIIVVVAIICFTALAIAFVVRAVGSSPPPPTKEMHMPTSLWTYERRPVNRCQYVKVLHAYRAKICTGDAGHEAPHTFMYIDLGQIDEEG